MTYKLDSQYIGYPPIEAKIFAAAAPTLASLPVSPGFIARAEDKVWGPGEFIFARANGVIPQYGLCVLTPVWDSATKSFRQDMTAVPNTANLGRPVYVAQCGGAMAAGDYGWFLMTGISPVNGTASVAADNAFGITAAGQVGANSAGKQVVGARVIQAATATVVKVGTAKNGSTIINVADTDGLFVGGYLSGTGVGASAVIVAIDPMGKYIIASVACTADINGGNITQTANNGTVFYNTAAFNRAFAQGAIT